MSETEQEKAMVGRAAAELVSNECRLGLGTGSTVRHFAEALGRRIARDGLSVRAVATSQQSRELAKRCAIPLAGLADLGELDLCVDGADEVAPDLAMIKGGGGALLWEKIVAAAARRRIYIADSSKLVARLGAVPLPVEVCRFGLELHLRRLTERADRASLRTRDGALFQTDSGNAIIDCHFGVISDAAALDRELTALPGVFETGLFVDMVDLLITCRAGRVISLATPAEAWWRGDQAPHPETGEVLP